MSRPRILLTNFHPKFSGGHASFLSRIATSWLNESFEFAFAAPEKSDIYQLGKKIGLQTFPCDFPAKLKELSAVLKNIKRFRSIIDEYKPDIVHCNGGADMALVTWSLMFRKDIPIIRHHHAVKSIGTDFYHRWIYKNKIAANVYVSNGARELSQSDGLTPYSPCHVIYNGIDTDYFKPLDCDANSLKDSYGISPDDFIFGSCAGLAGYKRIDLILKATQRLQEKYRFKIMLLGSEEQYPRHKKMADQLGIADRLIYCGRQSDIRPFVARFDIGFVLSDSIETSSYAAREMMALGKPLISSSFTGLKENFTDKIQGFFCKPGDLDTLCACMEQFLTMPEAEKLQMGEAARKYAVEHFDRNKTLGPLKDLYDQLVRPKSEHIDNI